jgi:hypothetical protein
MSGIIMVNFFRLHLFTQFYKFMPLCSSAEESCQSKSLLHLSSSYSTLLFPSFIFFLSSPKFAFQIGLFSLPSSDGKCPRPVLQHSIFLHISFYQSSISIALPHPAAKFFLPSSRQFSPLFTSFIQLINCIISTIAFNPLALSSFPQPNHLPNSFAIAKRGQVAKKANFANSLSTAKSDLFGLMPLRPINLFFWTENAENSYILFEIDKPFFLNQFKDFEYFPSCELEWTTNKLTSHQRR